MVAERKSKRRCCCGENFFSNDKAPDFIYIDFWERSKLNKLARVIYKFWRCFYIVLYFYFPPQIGLYFSYEVPFLASGYWWQKNPEYVDNFGNVFSGARRLHAISKDFLFGDETWDAWTWTGSNEDSSSSLCASPRAPAWCIDD